VKTATAFGWLLGALCALGLPAHALASSPPSNVDLPRVLPVWSNDSGRVEALLLVDQPAGTPALNPLDSLFGATPQLGLRGRARTGTRSGVNLDLSVTAAPAMALLCDGNIGLAAALGRLNDQCLLTRLDAEAQPGMLQRFGVSTDWTSQSGNIDLSFGLSWLDGSADLRSDFGLALPTPYRSDVIHPGLPSQWQLQGQEILLQGQGWLGPRTWLRVEGRHARTRTEMTGMPSLFGHPLEWDNTSLTLSGGHRAFSGNITGRMIELTQPRQTWTDVDFSVSWRTPWDARLSVGARNLLGGPDRDRWPMATLPGMPESEARTPYVRYHQDL
jgi:hypothetical protein